MTGTGTRVVLAERVAAIPALGVPAWRCYPSWCLFGVWHAVAGWFGYVARRLRVARWCRTNRRGRDGCSDENCTEKHVLNLLVGSLPMWVRCNGLRTPAAKLPWAAFANLHVSKHGDGQASLGRSHGLVTLSTTVSPGSTVVPGAGSMPTTVQFAGTNTFWYFEVAEASSTFVNPRAFSLFSAILAFCPVKSGMVTGPDAAGVVVDGALAVQDGTLGADFVTVTVEGGLAVLPPQAATVSATAHTAAANWATFRLTVAERVSNFTSACCHVPFGPWQPTRANSQQDV
jgi:hypothetical protein